MTTLIEQHTENERFFTLTTEKRSFEVSIAPQSLGVYIQRNGLNSLTVGKHFHADSTEEAFINAIEAYKASDVKAALRSLLGELLDAVSIHA